jgi:hypothetical protein
VANELRVRSAFLGGLIEDNPLSSSATTLTSAGLASAPVIGSTQHMAIVLDPDGFSGSPEVVYITAHSAAASTATIVRGQEGSTARAHDRDTPWVHSVTVKDFDAAGGGTGLIGLTSYRPGSDAATYGPGPGVTMTDIDAANLSVSFTAPPSGRVLVSLASSSYRSTNDRTHWALREGSTTVAEQYISSIPGYLHYVSVDFYVSGLTPATVYTYKWAWRSASASNIYLYGGPTYGAFLMKVLAVNV